MKNLYRPAAARICLLILAAVLTAAGVVMEQPESVLAKAVTICLECVGLG